MALIPVPRFHDLTESTEEVLYPLGEYRTALHTTEDYSKSELSTVSVQPSDQVNKFRVTLCFEKAEWAKSGQSPNSETSVLTLVVVAEPRELALLTGFIGRTFHQWLPRTEEEKSYSELWKAFLDLQERYNYLTQSLREFQGFQE